MTTFSTFVRGAAAAAVLATATISGGCRYAAPEDVALLHDYLGSWKGTGTITGPKGNTETTACRLDFFDGNGDKVNFSGRCSLSGTTVTMNGAMVYVDAAGNYEAVMTTSVGFTGRAVGVRRGDQVRFDLREVGGDESVEQHGRDVVLHDGGRRRSTSASRWSSRTPATSMSPGADEVSSHDVALTRLAARGTLSRVRERGRRGGRSA